MLPLLSGLIPLTEPSRSDAHLHDKIPNMRELAFQYADAPNVHRFPVSRTRIGDSKVENVPRKT